MADQAVKLDQDLDRLLESMGRQSPLPSEVQQQMRQSQSVLFAWPWQVPQVPAYTSDHVPNPQSA